MSFYIQRGGSCEKKWSGGGGITLKLAQLLPATHWLLLNNILCGEEVSLLGE